MSAPLTPFRDFASRLASAIRVAGFGSGATPRRRRRKWDVMEWRFPAFALCVAITQASVNPRGVNERDARRVMKVLNSAHAIWKDARVRVTVTIVERSASGPRSGIKSGET